MPFPPLPRPATPRFPLRKQMTIAAGFVCGDGLSHPRPSGKRFGTMVHALLATLPLDAAAADATELAALYAKLFAAPDAERDAAAAIGASLVKHSRWQAAKAAADAGRRVWREAPVSWSVKSTPGDK